jgi:nickel transport system permease protein
MMKSGRRILSGVPAYIFISFAILAGIILLGMFAPQIAPQNPAEIDLGNPLAGMSLKHPLGTDDLGRCIFSRCLFGIRTSIGMAVFIAFVSVAAGTFVGMVSGYAGGILDKCVWTLSNALLAFPSLILVILIIGFLGPSTNNIIVAMLAINWIWYARVARSLTLRVREYDFVQAAKLNGSGPWQIIWKHILPNLMSQMIIQFTLCIGSTVLGLAGFSFLGLGVQPPTAELGLMISEGCALIQTTVMVMLWPSLFLIGIVLTTNIIGEYAGDRMRRFV